MALRDSTKTTEEDWIRRDGLTSFHGSDSTLTPSSVEGDYLLLFAVQSSHHCTVLIWWDQFSVSALKC